MRKRNLDKLLDMHKAFWNRKDGGRLVSTEYSTPIEHELVFTTVDKIPLANGTYPKDHLLLQPEMFSPSKIYAAPRYYEDLKGEAPKTSGDLFRIISPLNPPFVLWLPAIVGCQLQVSTIGNTVYPLPCLDNRWHERSNEKILMDERWLDKLLEFTDYIVEHFHPYYLVNPGYQRGPGDLLYNIMRTENMITGMHTHPKEMKDLLSRLTDIFIQVTKAQLNATPKFEDGYCIPQYGIWTPGTCTRSQEDYPTTILSPKLFKEFIVPCEKRIAESFTYSFIHVHSGSARLAELLTEIDALGAIEICFDGPPFSSGVEKLLPLLKRLQKKKPLIVSGVINPKEFDILVKELSPRGLLIYTSS
jgi:hypothetical protein